MPPFYVYEIWGKKKKLGSKTFSYPIHSNFIEVTVYAMLKEPYRMKEKLRKIKVPVTMRVVTDDGVDVTYRRVLNLSNLPEKKRRRLRKYWKEND